MDINTNSVLDAASTKWNFLPFKPGLVGGHCIGVDPYYLTYKAEQMGYHPQVILSGRRINDNMGNYVVSNVIKKLIQANVNVLSAKVAILGFTFKENTPDTRNTRVIDIVKELNEFGIQPMIIDPQADQEEAQAEYGLTFHTLEDAKDLDAVILAVSHDEFVAMDTEAYEKLFKNASNDSKVVVDIKGILDKDYFEEAGYQYWAL